MLYSKDILSFEDGKITYKISDQYNHRFKINPIKKWVDSLYEWVSVIIFGLCVFIVCFMFVFRISTVYGSSMESTLHQNERLLLFSTSRYERNDIVVIEQGDEYYIKRIIAVSGDKIRIDSVKNEVFLNGEKIDEPYVKGTTTSKGFGDKERTVPDGCVFVMGDNRVVSLDSREIEGNFIQNHLIVGKAVARYFPFDKLKVLT